MYRYVYWHSELFHINLTVLTRYTIFIRYRVVSRRVVFTIEFISIENRVELAFLKEKTAIKRAL